MHQQTFDLRDPKNLGRPFFFDLGDFINAIEMLIRADEIQTALALLDKAPAWYRENQPAQLTEIRNKIYRQIYSSIEYSTDDEEFEFSCKPEIAEQQWVSEYCYPRSEILTAEVKRLNEMGQAPFIVDLGCSHGNLPLGLKKLGCKFNYLGLAPNYRAAQKVKEWVGDDIWSEKPKDNQEVWLACFEVLEHCMDPHSLVIDTHKRGFEYSQMYWSTPYGCLYGGLSNWDTRRLGHVRGWTGQEFFDFVSKNFPGFKWQLFKSHSMVLVGKK